MGHADQDPPPDALTPPVSAEAPVRQLALRAHDEAVCQVEELIGFGGEAGDAQRFLDGGLGQGLIYRDDIDQALRWLLIPVLTLLLADPKTADLGRYALERIPGPGVDRALRETLATGHTTPQIVHHVREFFHARNEGSEAPQSASEPRRSASRRVTPSHNAVRLPRIRNMVFRPRWHGPLGSDSESGGRFQLAFRRCSEIPFSLVAGSLSLRFRRASPTCWPKNLA